MASGQSACCLLGDICLSGSTCWNFDTGNLYQYGCTDITYKDETCPYKCGSNSTLSPWTALEYCVDQPGEVNDTWVCHNPESCGCEWDSSPEMLILQPRGCKDMGSDAKVALYAPSTLAPYLSLPTSIGGSTGYISTTKVNGTSTWISTVIPGYTPATVTELTNYGHQPTQIIFIDEKAKPSASTVAAAESIGASASPGSTNSTTSTNAQSQSGLSTAAKAGIGAGIGAGIMIALLVAILVLLARIRKRRAATQAPVQRPGPHPYLGSHPYSTGMSTGGSSIGATPKPTSPYYFPQTPAQTEEEKEAWQAAYPSGSPPPPMLSPHYDPNYDPTMATNFQFNMPFSSQVVPSLYSSADQRSQQGKNQSPLVSPPPLTELSADRHVHELHSEGVMSEKQDRK